EIYVEIGVPPTAPPNYEFFVCQPAPNTGTATFDLTSADAFLLGGQTDVSLTWFEDQNDANNGTNPISNPTNYTNTTPFQQTVYIRLESALPGNCHVVAPVDIIVGVEPDLPSSSQIPTLNGCDDGTGTAIFDLTQRFPDVTINIPNATTNVVVSYYNNLNDAQFEIGAIATPNAYVGTSGETIYVRVENVSDGCYAVTSFDLHIIQLTYNTPLALDICENDLNPNDGFADFDLNTATTQITTGSSSNLALTYYTDQNDAQTGTGTTIPTTVNYINTTPDIQTIYVRIEDAANPNCFVVEPLVLNVVPIPTTFPAELILCDIGNDGSEAFTLTNADAVVSGGVGSVVVTYYATQSDADLGAPGATPLSSPYVSGNTTVFARVESTVGDCYNTSEVTLTLNPSPDLNSPVVVYEQCDDGDGTVEFDLTSWKGQIINDPNLSDYTVTYYASQADLNNNTPILPADETAYENTSPTQTIFVVVAGLNGCTSEGQFDIVVNSLPTYDALSSLETCDRLGDVYDGLAEFDLTDAESQLDDGTGAVITFYNTQADAQAGISGTEISTTTPYAN